MGRKIRGRAGREGDPTLIIAGQGALRTPEIRIEQVLDSQLAIIFPMGGGVAAEQKPMRGGPGSL